MKLTTLAITALMGIALSGPATAQPGGRGHHDGPPPPGPDCKSPRHLAALATYDTNKNGKLDRDELRAMHDARRRADLARYDADKNGTLDKQERAKLQHDRIVEHFEEIDRSRDAEISRAEAQAACGPLKHHFDEVDRDGNGSVSWAEFEKAAKRRRPPRAKHGRHGPPPHGKGAD